MLRYWAMNMEAAGYSWIGFGYESQEKRRFAAIKAALPAGAYSGWLVFTVVFYGIALSVSVGIFFGPLLIFYPRGTPMPDSIFYVATAGMLISATTFGLPLAMMLGGRIVDWMSGAPPLAAAPGDAALYGKIRRQIGRMALFGVAMTGILNWVTWVFDVDLTQYDGVVRWSYFGVLAAQALLAYPFVRERK